MDKFHKIIKNFIANQTFFSFGTRRILNFWRIGWPTDRLERFSQRFIVDRHKRRPYETMTATGEARKRVWRSLFPNRLLSAIFLRQPQTSRLLLGVAIVTTWGCWNGKLLLSTGAGVIVMVLVYRMQQWDWQVHWSEFWQLLTGSNRHLTLAVGCGAVATTIAYMSISIWVDLENHWIASGLILQNLGLVAILSLLICLVIGHRASQKQVFLERMLANLSDVDPLKRLIAVREITRWVTNTNFAKSDPSKLFLAMGDSAKQIKKSSQFFLQRSHIVECFHLMLSRESEAIVRDAIFDALQALDSFPKKVDKSQYLSVDRPEKNSQPLQIKHPSYQEVDT